MKEREVSLEFSGDVQFFVFCNECDMVLYQATKDDWVTRLVAQDYATRHISAFTRTHNVIIVDITQEIIH